jgi:hypothetical protein
MVAAVFMCSQSAQAEATGSPDTVAVRHAPIESADRPAPNEHVYPDFPPAEHGLRGYDRIIKTVAKPSRMSIRNRKVTRMQQTPELRKAASALWSYSSRWSTGLILGVGF